MDKIIHRWKDFLLKNQIDRPIMERRNIFVASCVSRILTVYGGPLKAENLDIKIKKFER